MEEEKTIYTGIAVGGPMDGRTVESRKPEGIIFVNKPENRVWVYDYFVEHRNFYARPLGYDVFWDEMNTEQRLEVIQETTLSGVDPMRELNKEKLLDTVGDDGWEIRALPQGGDE